MCKNLKLRRVIDGYPELLTLKEMSGKDPSTMNLWEIQNFSLLQQRKLPIVKTNLRITWNLREIQGSTPLQQERMMCVKIYLKHIWDLRYSRYSCQVYVRDRVPNQ